MAIALKTMNFNTAKELTAYTADAGNNVATIVSIVYDAASGKYVLFYTS